MENYKMPNYEQWLDWLDKKHHGNYRLYEYSDNPVYKDIIVYAPGYHDAILAFDKNGELEYISVY